MLFLEIMSQQENLVIMKKINIEKQLTITGNLYPHFKNLYLIICLFIFTFLLGQSVQINEVVSSNGSSFYDEDGDTPDWIELYNTTDQPIDLLGYGITDDPGDLSKWVFPSLYLQPNSFFVLFASDKDRTDNIVLKQGRSYLYM